MNGGEKANVGERNGMNKRYLGKLKSDSSPISSPKQ